MINQELGNFIETVGDAQRAMIEAQGKGDIESFQQAQYRLKLAESMLLDIKDLDLNDKQRKEIHQAREMLRQLAETQESIRIY